MRRSLERHENQKAWLLVAPAVLVMIMVALVPLIDLIDQSIRAEGGASPAQFIGTINDPAFWQAVGWSAGFAAVCLLIEIPLGIWIAANLPRRGPWALVALMIVALPIVTPLGTAMFAWRLPEDGLAEALISAGVDAGITQPIVALALSVLVDIWSWTSLVTLIIYAGLGTIPQRAYDMARVDGATRGQVFGSIEWPRIAHLVLIAAFVRLLAALVTPASIWSSGVDRLPLVSPCAHCSVLQTLSPPVVLTLTVLLYLPLAFIFFHVLTRGDLAPAPKPGRAR